MKQIPLNTLLEPVEWLPGIETDSFDALKRLIGAKRDNPDKKYGALCRVTRMPTDISVPKPLRVAYVRAGTRHVPCGGAHADSIALPLFATQAMHAKETAVPESKETPCPAKPMLGYGIPQCGDLLWAIEFPHSEEKIECTLGVADVVVDTYVSCGGAHNTIQLREAGAVFPVLSLKNYACTLLTPQYSEKIGLVYACLDNEVRNALSSSGFWLDSYVREMLPPKMQEACEASADADVDVPALRRKLCKTLKKVRRKFTGFPALQKRLDAEHQRQTDELQKPCRKLTPGSYEKGVGWVFEDQSGDEDLQTILAGVEWAPMIFDEWSEVKYRAASHCETFEDWGVFVRRPLGQTVGKDFAEYQASPHPVGDLVCGVQFLHTSERVVCDAYVGGHADGQYVGSFESSGGFGNIVELTNVFSHKGADRSIPLHVFPRAVTFKTPVYYGKVLGIYGVVSDTVRDKIEANSPKCWLDHLCAAAKNSA